MYADDGSFKSGKRTFHRFYTRGIENPSPRTCLVQIKCGAADWIGMSVAVAFFALELCLQGGVIG